MAHGDKRPPDLQTCVFVIGKYIGVTFVLGNTIGINKGQPGIRRRKGDLTAMISNVNTALYLLRNQIIKRAVK